MSNPFSKYLFSSQNRRNVETHPKRTVFLTRNNNNNNSDSVTSIANHHAESNNFTCISNKVEQLQSDTLTSSEGPEGDVTSMPLTHSTFLPEFNYYSRSHEEFPFSPNGTNSGYEQILERRSRDAFDNREGISDLVSPTSSPPTTVTVATTATTTTTRATEYTNLYNNVNAENDEPESKRAKEENLLERLKTKNANSQTVLSDSTNSENKMHCNVKTNTTRISYEVEKQLAHSSVANSEKQEIKHRHHHQAQKSNLFHFDDDDDDDDDESDDDELHLLLGSQEARRVKTNEKSNDNNKNVNVHMADTSNTTIELLANTMETQCTGLPTIAELPWQSRSHSSLENIQHCFQREFEYLLHHSSSLYNSFAPFFKVKMMERIKNDFTLAPQFACATNVTVEMITSLLNEVRESKLKEVEDVVAAATSTNAAQDATNIALHEKHKTQPTLSLRSYQLDGVVFLLTQFQKGMSCILADDMGLGKTAQLCSFLRVLWKLYAIDGPHLIVAPLSTLTNWTRELAQWAPELILCKYHGEKQTRQRHRHVRVHTSPHKPKNNINNTNINKSSERHVVFITTPSVFHQERGFFCKQYWASAIVDEAHVLKGSNTRISHAARKLQACFRVAVTGTPIQNNVGEVWNLMSFLYPHYVSTNNYNYNYKYTTNATTNSTATRTNNSGEEYISSALHAAEHCANLLHHIMLRRTKEMVDLGIPPRMDEPVTFLQPTPVQEKLLSMITAHALHDASNRNARQLQGHFTRQRIICNHPLALQLLLCNSNSFHSTWQTSHMSPSLCASHNHFETNTHQCYTAIEAKLHSAGISLTEEEVIYPSAKMRYLDSLLASLKQDGHRVLIFSNFTSTLDFLEALCALRQYRYERLDGTCNRVERELAMLRFNQINAKRFCFLVTTTAGGVGITLTGADTVILFDAHYNPQLDRQAADRAHRIGQTKPVHVFRLCLRNTIEESIRVIAKRKASLGDYIIQSGSNSHNKKSSKVSSSHKVTQNVNHSLTAEEMRQILQDLMNTKSKNNVSKPQIHSDNTINTNDNKNTDNKDVACVNGSMNHLTEMTTAVDVDNEENFDACEEHVHQEPNQQKKHIREYYNVMVEDDNTPNDDVMVQRLLECIEESTNESFTDEDDGQKKVAKSNGISSMTCTAQHYATNTSNKGNSNTYINNKCDALNDTNSDENECHTGSRCFVCKMGMKPLKLFYHCMVCPKVYHAECIHEKVLEDGEMPRRQWVCPRHNCYECNKPQNADGAIFMCVNCPRSFCFDCLDSHYYELSDDGLELQYVSRTYDDMYKEGMQERRSCYYITCMHCVKKMNDKSLISSLSSSSSSLSMSSSSLEEEHSSLSSLDESSEEEVEEISEQTKSEIIIEEAEK